MKRYEVTTRDGYVLKLFYNSIEECKSENKNAISIIESNDYEYLKYIELIKNNSIETIQIIKNGKKVNLYKILLNDGYIWVRIGEVDGFLLDYVEYQIWYNNRYTQPITWTMGNPKDFYNKYMCVDKVEFKVYSCRKYGQPKLSKPKELKGIKQCGSADFIPKKCSCQLFIKDNDLYIKHRDYFSERLKGLDGTPLEYRIKVLGINSKKSSNFIYDDCWGDIVLRNEAWIVFKGILSQKSISDEKQLARLMFDKFNEFYNVDITYYCDNIWETFFENVSKELYRNV